MSVSSAAWQGKLDNLCGIYCITYAIARSKAVGRRPSTRERNAFWRSLHAAQELKLLDADRIGQPENGYVASELVSIFNKIPRRFRSGMRAVALKEFDPNYDGSKRSLNTVFDKGGVAIIDIKSGYHWVLAASMNEDGSVNCIDPSANNPVEIRVRASSSEGVAIIPI